MRVHFGPAVNLGSPLAAWSAWSRHISLGSAWNCGTSFCSHVWLMPSSPVPKHDQTAC